MTSELNFTTMTVEEFTSYVNKTIMPDVSYILDNREMLATQIFDMLPAWVQKGVRQVVASRQTELLDKLIYACRKLNLPDILAQAKQACKVYSARMIAGYEYSKPIINFDKDGSIKLPKKIHFLEQKLVCDNTNRFTFDDTLNFEKAAEKKELPEISTEQKAFNALCKKLKGKCSPYSKELLNKLAADNKLNMPNMD